MAEGAKSEVLPQQSDPIAAFSRGDLALAGEDWRAHQGGGRDGRMNIGKAVQALKDGKRVARAGWNGKGMWLAYSPGHPALLWDRFWAVPNAEYAKSQPHQSAAVLPCITMKTATGEIQMGWVCSQPDLLAEDWEIVP